MGTQGAAEGWEARFRGRALASLKGTTGPCGGRAGRPGDIGRARVSHGLGRMADPSSAVREYYRQILPFYDLELADRGDGAFWAWAASEPAGCRVLEVGAGTGRATAFLARSAGSVTALDLDLDLLAVARGKAAPNVRLVAADMRQLGLAARFDLVAAVDDPFVHLTADGDRELALTGAAGLLRPGGRLLLDAAWLSPADRRRAATPEGLVRERAHGENGELVVRQRWCSAGASRLCMVRFDYRWKGREVAAATFPARLWSVAEIHRRCRAAGLRPSTLWGGYDRRPWSRPTSRRLIVEAHKLEG